jgi:uncharacterized protein (TIGR02284 family)
MPDQMTSDGRVTDLLQDLAAVCRAEQEGYRGAAEATAALDLKAVLARLARQREQAADALDQLVREHGGRIGAHGVVGGYTDRLFASLRAALMDDDRAAALGEVARGESYTEAAFDRIKQSPLNDRARGVVQQLHGSIKQSRDRMRRLAAGENRWTIGAGRRSLDTMGHYVADHPKTSGVIELGVGFALGALAMLVTRPPRRRSDARSNRA